MRKIEMTDLDIHRNPAAAGRDGDLCRSASAAEETLRSPTETKRHSGGELWLNEAPDEAAGQRLRIGKTVFRGTSEYQNIWVFDNPVFGRVLALDDHVQTTVQDEFIYHEMMAHVPMFAHGGARDVLIVGGGDGGVLREVLKHRSVRRTVMVEIDRQVVDVCRTHLSSLGGNAFADPRAEIMIDDGAAFLRRTSETFDVILVDAPDPIGPGQTLFSSEFLRACRARLRPGGILVVQSGVSFLQAANIRRTVTRLRELFQDVSAYTAMVPTYYGGAMTFACASNAPQRLAVAEETLAMRYAAARIRTRCYTPALHVASFALPRYLADQLWRSRNSQPHGMVDRG
jgi:spermidine synthase